MNRTIPLSIVAIVGVLLFGGAQAFAAEILLKNGNSGKGNVIELNDTNVKMDLGGVELVYDLKNIQSINGIVDVSRTKLSDMAKLAHEYTVSAKYSEALPILDQLEELALPSNLDIAADYAEVLDGTDRYEKALPYLQKALEKEPGDWLHWHRFGHSLRHTVKDKKATLEAYEKAHSLQPPEIQKVLASHNVFDIGITYGDFGDWKGAVPYLEKALFSPIPPGANLPPYFYENMAYAYVFAGEYPKAVSVCQEALEKYDPSSMGLICHYLGFAFQALGQSERAALCEAKAKELGYIQRFSELPIVKA
ncbi:MAG: tetratricopeptide repeat protein [Candidatus Omnitrophota bacterium]